MQTLLISFVALAQATASPPAPDQADELPPPITLPAQAQGSASGTTAAAPSAAGDLRRQNGFMTGEELFRRCTDPSPSGGIYCFGYLAAVNDSVRAYERWLNIREYCVSSAVTMSELRDVFIDEGRNRPSALRGQAASFVVNAFKRRFPC